MRFSVIIPTYNRRAMLLRCLAAVTTLDYPDYEVIVVDDGSTDGSIDAARAAFPSVQYLPHPTNSAEPSARNRGLAAARGDIIAFTDDDCIAPPDWLGRHARYYRDPDIAAVGGPQICRNPNFFERFDTVRYAVKFHECVQTVESIDNFEHLITGNMSVRRTAIDRVGLFDERFASGCDSDFIRRLSRAGYRFVRDGTLQVEHLKVYTLGSYLRMRFHRGCGAVLTDVKEGTLTLRRFVPFINLTGAYEHWQHYRKHFGGGPGAWLGFWSFAVLTRCIDVTGRAYSSWVAGRRYHASV
jgi:glycosyltransferase involved in cell wall biosynthesis